MKKVGILTFQNAHNYGAVLQLYALKTFLCKNGYDAKAINYINKCIEKNYPKFPIIEIKTDRKLSIIKSILMLPITIVKNLYALRQYRIKYKKFTKFINQLTDSKKISNLREIDCSKEYHAFVCGSDQIWNPTLTGGLDGAYFCDFDSDAIKIAYSASMGLKKLPPKEELSFQRMINNFDYVGVRENSLKEYISKFSNKDVEVTVDPTLLLEKEDYIHMTKENKNGRYIFLYSLIEDKKLYSIADKLSKKLNIPIVELRYNKLYSHRKYIQVADSGPEEFLSFIKNAEIVITNSFHGTIFSIMFEKKFYTVFNEWGSSRLETLLINVGLKDRCISFFEEIDVDNAIEYDKVKSKLKDLRKKSAVFLLESLKGKETTDVLSNRKICTGCTACVTSCPVNAITMIEDVNGFKYPSIDLKKCIKCGKCQKVCPVNNYKNDIEKATKCFAFVSDEAKTSQSGGAGAALAKKFILDGGVVYGCVVDNLQVIHQRINSIDEIIKLKGAKYTQSNLFDIFNQIKKDLKLKNKVLFLGTPCQVAGLKSVIGTNLSDNLYTCDLICHGVVSPLIYEEYIKFMNTKTKQDISNMLFRDKSYGWQSPVETLTYKNGKKESFAYYKNIFYTDKCLRESCYDCKFCNLNRVSDITIGDFWGIEKTDFNYKYNQGVSNIIVNTEKGKKLFEHIKENNNFKEYDIKKGMQHNLKNSTEKPKDTNIFWEEYHKNGFEFIIKKYGQNNLKNTINTRIFVIKVKLKRKIKQILKRG